MREKFVGSNTYIRKEEGLKIRDQNVQHKKLEKKQQNKTQRK